MEPHKAKPAIVMTRFPYESSWGGEESHTLSLAHHLRNQGYEVIFMGSCPMLLERFKEEGFLTRPVWGGKMIVTKWELLKSFILFPFIRRSLRKAFIMLMQQYRIKALYCLSLNEKLFLSPYAVSKSIPVTWVEHQEIRGWLTKSPWRKTYRKNAQQVRIVPISKKNEKTLHQLHIHPTHIQEIVNGVDIQSTKKRKTQKGKIISANRFIPKKGMVDVIRAVSIVAKKHPHIKLTLIGEGEEKEELEYLAQKNKELLPVHINNFLKKEKWYELLSSCDVYVSASRDQNDTFNLSVAEALSAGCKVVITSCTGIASYLEDGKQALFAEPMNPKDLAEKIEKALSLPESFRADAQMIAKEKFNKETMLRQYKSLIFRQS